MSQVIPDGWVKTSLSEVVTVNPKHKDLEDQEAGFVPMALAPTDFNGTLNYEERQWDKIKKGYTHFATGDVIFAKVTPCFENGKAAIVKELPNDIGAGSTEFYVLRPVIKDISVIYIFAVIKSYDFLQTGAENMTGAVGLRRVPKKFVEDYKINLPPLPEQKVIADQLDELLAQVESTKARLDAIPAILNSFRQSVLSAAVSGKLTEEWRGASETVGWKSGLLGEFVIKPSYGSSAKSSKEGLVPVLRMGNLQGGKLDWSNLAYTSDKEEIDKYRLNSGDVLFNRTNSPELVGKTSIFRGEREAIYAGYLIKITCLGCLNPEFLNFHLNSLGAKEYCRMVKSDGVSQSNINAKKLAAYPMILPPIKEQIEIVGRVEELFALADKVEAQVNAAQTRVNNLTQSILAKAFRGELTADWRAANPELITGDNSAESLLERIKAEREALALAAKAAKKKPVNKARAKKAVTNESHIPSINRNLSPVESVIADGVAHKPQEIFDKLTPDLSMTEVFNEISKLLSDNKIEEKTVDGITGFFIK
ncbi:restriction endonuclease subunit S [Vibrio splendidus]|uniref:restriction endonuclease subunit S n=1 Tax=Vibrio splendidus TaxID=29497 RepID=UPI0008090CD0|nr:restriction endonuclease subunit S [Vibrio splendidus]SBS64738.1 Type-1 restriction enzyme EcoKI specificity protein [Vibrio splendidus]